jgi:endonuclease/exonuclease/phosphatase family metal-dependent hydrolase
VLCSQACLAQQDLRVMTFNIRFDNPEDGINSWENRSNFVVKTLGKESPDILGLQEVLQRQLVYLIEELKDYSYVGVGRDDGKTGGEYSPVLYKKERFQVLEWGTFWLSATPEDTGSVGWDAALPRICTWVKFNDLRDNRQFFFLNTHFDHMGQNARMESARLILNFIAKNTSGLPVIVTGDFNSGPSQEPYLILTNPGNGLQDVCLLANNPQVCSEGSFNGFGNSDEKERIDLILLKGNCNVLSVEMLKEKKGEMYISDHWPVVADISRQ